jgi:hypothetical protein
MYNNMLEETPGTFTGHNTSSQDVGAGDITNNAQSVTSVKFFMKSYGWESVHSMAVSVTALN